jgi:ankyrin repeat protein
MVDFKKQTPLILASDHGWDRLVEVLLPHSDMNAQDYLGRTALHAAVARRSEKCVSILLVSDPDVSLVTKDEKHSVLHTAVQVGCVECVRKIVDEFPGLLFQENADGLTPALLARDSTSNIDELNAILVSNNRKQVCHSDFRSIIEILESAEDFVR